MAVENLLFIGAILSVTLGCLALRLVRKNENLEWNENLAAHLICMMFIAKGLQNAAGGYFNSEGVGSAWQFWRSLMFLLDYFFSASIMMIALVYPIPILRTPRQLKIGYGIIAVWMVIRILLVTLGKPHTVIELAGALYIVCGPIWGSVYIKFRMLNPEHQNEATKHIALVSGLFLTLLFGHIWMFTPDMLLHNEVFYFMDLWGGTDLTSRTYDYIWQMGQALGIAVGLAILFVEVRQAFRGQTSPMLYIIITYILAGMIRYLMSSFNTIGGVGLSWNDDFSLLGIWNLLTANLHFTIARPLIAMYILLRYGMFNINDSNRATARLMTVMLIVVATSAVLELIQTVIPINQMLSAALMGIVIAFGVGWEEKSFDSMVSNQLIFREHMDKSWFPTIEIPQHYMNRLVMVSAVYIVLIFFLAFIYWQADIYEKLLEGA